MARRAVEELQSNLRLEIRQRLTDSGLRPSQLAAGGGKASRIHRGDEGSQLIEGDRIEHIHLFD